MNFAVLLQRFVFLLDAYRIVGVDSVRGQAAAGALLIRQSQRAHVTAAGVDSGAV